MDGVLQRKNELDEGGRKVRVLCVNVCHVSVCLCVGVFLCVRY